MRIGPRQYLGILVLAGWVLEDFLLALGALLALVALVALVALGAAVRLQPTTLPALFLTAVWLLAHLTVAGWRGFFGAAMADSEIPKDASSAGSATATSFLRTMFDLPFVCWEASTL